MRHVCDFAGLQHSEFEIGTPEWRRFFRGNGPVAVITTDGTAPNAWYVCRGVWDFVATLSGRGLVRF